MAGVSKFLIEYLVKEGGKAGLKKAAKLAPEEASRIARFVEREQSSMNYYRDLRPKKLRLDTSPPGGRFSIPREPDARFVADVTRRFAEDLKNANLDENISVTPRWEESVTQTIISGAVAYDKVFNEPLDLLVSGALNKDAWAIVEDLTAPPTEIKLPEGVEWRFGPCSEYIRNGIPCAPSGTGVSPGVCAYGFVADWAPTPPQADVVTNNDLAAGLLVNMNHSAPMSDNPPWTGQYWGFGAIWAPDPQNFEPWDSTKHGGFVYPTKTIPLWFGVDDAIWFDPHNQRLKDMGLPGWQSPADMWNHVTDAFGPPANWTREGLVWNPPRTGRFPWEKMPPQPHPGTGPNAGGGSGSTINPYMRLNNGFRQRPGKRVRERKPKTERLIWSALSVYGKYTEFEDAVKAIYKGLPKKLRQEIWKLNGYREPSIPAKVGYIIANLGSMRWDQALIRLVATNIDDMISSMATDDNLAPGQSFLIRGVSRRAWREMQKKLVEQHPEFEDKLPSLEKKLEEYGYLKD